MIVCLDIPRPRGEVLRLSVTMWGGLPRIGLRLWYQDKHGELAPSRHGVTIPVEYVPAIIDALGKAARITAQDLM